MDWPKEINENPFIIYADCEVIYNGRAASVLNRGNYVIIRKVDGSFLIHGSNKSTPINYQGPKSKIKIINDQIIVNRKKESIIVKVYCIRNINVLEGWSVGNLNISMTEKDLVKKFIANPEQYLRWQPATVTQEFKTAMGPVDVLCIDALGGKSIIEFKRHKITLNHCMQLKKYVEAMGSNVIGYVAAPDINKKALEYCHLNNFNYIKIDF
jgi:RecB family endonuclease NucS